MKKIFGLLFACLLMTACQTKETYVKDFNSFVEKVQKEAADYTAEDWEKADKKFEMLSTENYTQFEQELSVEEKAEIMKLQATYAATKVKAGIKDAAKKVDGFIKGLKEGSK